jgi:hypothetical protein
MAIDLTAPSKMGFHAETIPVVLSTEPIFFIGTEPFSVLKSPPRYTFEPDTSIVLIVPEVFGFHGVNSRVDKLKEAKFFRALSPILVNWPPTYKVLPSVVIVLR